MGPQVPPVLPGFRNQIKGYAQPGGLQLNRTSLSQFREEPEGEIAPMVDYIMRTVMAEDYREKFRRLAPNSLFPRLDEDTRRFIENLSLRLRLTFQELRIISLAARDLGMWDGPQVQNWWKTRLPDNGAPGLSVLQIGRLKKKEMWAEFLSWYDEFRCKPPRYRRDGPSITAKEKADTKLEQSIKTVTGQCPVASPETVCCLLKTIDAVLGCPYACSYCTIQTFYKNTLIFDRDFHEKLKNIDVEPDRFQRYGSGQSSDSLALGNRYGVLDSLISFAEDHPQILLELKTKSGRIGYLLERAVPRNLVCTWSLNTETIIRWEEHRTPGLDERIGAARKAADAGVKVGFHFHPTIRYEGWEDEYEHLVSQILKQFSQDEVLYVSFGTITLIKPVVRAIREQGGKSRILQMPTALDPKRKTTYPDDIKTELIQHLVDRFKPWRDRVFFYLCMEKPEIWESVFGFTYTSNEEFEQEFGRKTMYRLD